MEWGKYRPLHPASLCELLATPRWLRRKHKLKSPQLLFCSIYAVRAENSTLFTTATGQRQAPPSSGPNYHMSNRTRKSSLTTAGAW